MKKKWELGADIDISKLLSSLQKAKATADDLDGSISDIGDYGNLNKLVDKFKSLSDVIEEMQGSLNALQAKLGKNVKGGFLTGLDSIFKKMADISDMSQKVFTGIANVKLKDNGVSAQLSKYAGQLNMLFKNLGINQQINIDLFNAMDAKQQFDELIKYAGAFGKELQITVGNIDTSAFENMGNDMSNNIKQSGQKITKEMQNQIDAIENKINSYKETFNELKLALKNAKKYNDFDEIDPGLKNVKDQDRYVQDAIDNYKQLRDATINFRNGSRTPVSAEDYELLVKYTNAVLKLTSLQDHTDKLTIKDNLSTALRNVFDKDENYDEWLSSFEQKFKTSITNALNTAITNSRANIDQIKRSAESSLSSLPSITENKNIDKRIQQYEELVDILQEYARALNTANNNAEDTSVVAVSDKLENALEKMSFGATKKEYRDTVGSIKDILGDLEYGDISAENIPSKLAEILGVEAPQAANKAEVSFANVTNELQDVENMALRVKKAFDMVHDADVEYRITVNGQDMDVREGLAKSINEKTIVEGYLANIQKGITVGAHSHRGISSGYSITDIKEAINSQYNGINAVSAIMGDKDITTINFSGVSREIANKILEAIEKDATMLSAGELKADAINKIAQKFGAGDIAKSWDSSDGFQSFAQYIYNIEKASQDAIQPVERLQNLLKYLKPDIDLSKYVDDLNNFSSGSMSITDVYNKIAKSEGLGTIVDNTNISTLTDASERLTRQQEEYQQKLDNIKITYQEILEKVEQVKAAGTTRSSVENVFGEYFNTKDLRDVLGSFELSDNFDIANKISDKFGIDNFDGILDILKTKVAGAESSISELQSLLSERMRLLEQVDNGGDTKNQDILRERAVNEEIRARISLLESEVTTRQLDVDNSTEKEKLALLEKEAAEKQKALDQATNLNKELSQSLSIEKELNNQLSDRALDEGNRAVQEKVRNDLLEEENATLREQLELTQQIVTQNNVDNDDNVEIIQKENGALEDKLEILRDIAEEYGIQVTQKDRTRYDELMLKDAESGLSSREEERLDELGDRIYDADEALNEFGATYDRIILKLANGKKVEILPDDDGLRKLNRIANEYYDGEYAGSEIENIQFERVKQQLGVEIPQAAEVAKETIKEVGQAIEQTQKNGITTETSNLYETASGQMSLLPIVEQEVAAKDELADKNREVTETQKEINQLQGQMSFDDIVKEETAAKQKLAGENKKVAETQKEINNENQKAQKGTKQQAQKTTKKTDAEKTIENEKISMSRRMRTADKRYDIITNNTGTSQMVGSARQAYNDYLAIYKEFKNLYNQINRGAISITPDVTKQFNILEASTKEALQNLDKIEKASKKLRENVGKANVQDLKPTDINNLDTLRQKMEDFARLTQGGTVTNLQFNESTKTLTYGLNNGRGTIEKMTISVDEYSNSLVRAKAKTGDITTTFGKFSKIMNEGWTNVFRYVSSFVGLYEVINQIRTGVTYVKEIDTALTELKKVTDETDATYDKFLKRMSKTAGVVGSTVANLTTMAAEWGRLGYSLQEAGDLAESTAILLNVSEFNDATEASEALISTIQAFGYAANESMSVVDVLNEIGNNFAISSDGIATALQDSASALMSAGNDLNQSVALIASANKVVQDPNSVGK